MPPVDAPPDVALTTVPINIRPWASATGLWVESVRRIFRAAGVGPGCARRYGPFWQKAMCVCGTQGERHSGGRKGARKQCPGNRFPHRASRVHSVKYTRASALPIPTTPESARTAVARRQA